MENDYKIIGILIMFASTTIGSSILFIIGMFFIIYGLLIDFGMKDYLTKINEANKHDI